MIQFKSMLEELGASTERIGEIRLNLGGNMNNHLDVFRRQLIRHEGKRNMLYKCPAGKWTIGIGYNIEDNGLPDKVIEWLFNWVIEAILHDLKRYGLFYVDGANEQRFFVLANMCFQLGLPRFKKFKRMLKLYRAGDFAGAADEMVDSKWYREDTSMRSRELVAQMRTGQWQKKFFAGQQI